MVLPPHSKITLNLSYFSGVSDNLESRYPWNLLNSKIVVFICWNQSSKKKKKKVLPTRVKELETTVLELSPDHGFSEVFISFQIGGSHVLLTHDSLQQAPAAYLISLSPSLLCPAVLSPPILYVYLC